MLKTLHEKGPEILFVLIFISVLSTYLYLISLFP